MKKLWIAMLIASGACVNMPLSAHCQMPCGIYHDDMIFDVIDQYIETMVKGISVMKESKFETPRDKNEFIRWVITKEKLSDQAAELITQYFLQQKIKPGESDTPKRLEMADKLLFLLVQIKQNVDISIVKEFYEVWERFKLQFHIAGYECEMENLKFEDRYLKKEHFHVEDEEHDHQHTHPHPKAKSMPTVPETK